MRLGLTAILAAAALVTAALIAREWIRSTRSAGIDWQADGGSLGEEVRAGVHPGVEHLLLSSSALKREVGVVVANPQGYDDASGRTRRWPVVYVGHGIGGNEWEIFEVAPELVLQLRQHAFVVGVNQGRSGGYGPAETMLAVELPAFVDEQRRTVTSARGRALTGFSLGGMTAVYVGFRHQDVFGTIGGFSSACYLIGDCERIRAAALATPLVPTSNVVLASGTAEDARIVSFQRQLAAALADHPDLTVWSLPGVGHDLAAQLRFRLEDGRKLQDAWVAAILSQLDVGR